MAGSNMFVLYTSSTGSNVTVSPRLGTGYVMPQHDTATQITLLSGSGVSGGTMTANMKCANCQSWSGGTMDFTASSASWIYAIKSGSSINSNDLNAGIGMHDSAAAFTWDMSSAKGGGDVNPFTSPITKSSSGSTSGAAGCSSVSISTPDSSDDSGGGDTKRKRDSSGCASGGGSTSTGSSSGSISQGEIILLHGVLASVAFVALFPIGGILIRVAGFTGLLWVHAILQIVALLVYIVAFGMGVYLALIRDMLDSAHPLLGIAIFFVLLAQPICGWVHHKLFKKHGRRTLWSYVHLYNGRIAILLGMVNVGLGLQLAENATSGQIIAYAAITTIVGFVYVAAAIYGEIKKKRKSKANQTKKPDPYQFGDFDYNGYLRDRGFHRIPGVHGRDRAFYGARDGYGQDRAFYGRQEGYGQDLGAFGRRDGYG